MAGKEDSLVEKGMQILRASLKACDPKIAIRNYLKVKDQRLFPADDYVFHVKDKDMERFSMDKSSSNWRFTNPVDKCNRC